MALLALVFAITQASVTAAAQATNSSGANQSTTHLTSSSNPSLPTAGSPNAKPDCNGGPCEDEQPRVIVTLPPPTPPLWSWHDRVLWAAGVLLAIEGLSGIMMALSVLKRIERQTISAGTAAAAAAVSAQAALLNAQAIIDSERPWLLITVEPSPGMENSFAVMATNRGRTPATIVATAEGMEFAIDEAHLPASPEYGEARPPRVPIILLSGESTPIESFSRDGWRRICESEERFTRVANWEEKAYIYGKVVYKDWISPSDKQLHETTWCCWYIHGRQKSGLVLAGPPDYNLHT